MPEALGGGKENNRMHEDRFRDEGEVLIIDTATEPARNRPRLPPRSGHYALAGAGALALVLVALGWHGRSDRPEGSDLLRAEAEGPESVVEKVEDGIDFLPPGETPIPETPVSLAPDPPLPLTVDADESEEEQETEAPSAPDTATKSEERKRGYLPRDPGRQRVKSALKKGNTERASRLAYIGMARSFEEDEEEFAYYHNSWVASNHKKEVERDLAAADTKRDPYAAARALTRATLLVEPAGGLSRRAVNDAGKLAWELGELGGAIVGEADMSGFELARISLEAADRWLSRGNGKRDERVHKALAKLEAQAKQELARIRMMRPGERQSMIREVLLWAPHQGPSSGSLQQMLIASTGS